MRIPDTTSVATADTVKAAGRWNMASSKSPTLPPTSVPSLPETQPCKQRASGLSVSFAPARSKRIKKKPSRSNNDKGKGKGKGKAVKGGTGKRDHELIPLDPSVPARLTRAMAKIQNGTTMQATASPLPEKGPGRKLPASAMAALKRLTVQQKAQKHASGIVEAKRMMQRLSMLDPDDAAGIAAIEKASDFCNCKRIGARTLPKPLLDPVVGIPRAVTDLEAICRPVQLRDRPNRQLGQRARAIAAAFLAPAHAHVHQGKKPMAKTGEETPEESLFRYASLGDLEVRIRALRAQGLHPVHGPGRVRGWLVC